MRQSAPSQLDRHNIVWALFECHLQRLEATLFRDIGEEGLLEELKFSIFLLHLHQQLSASRLGMTSALSEPIRPQHGGFGWGFVNQRCHSSATIYGIFSLSQQRYSTHTLQVREAAQLTHVPDGPLFLGDGSLAGAPAPKPTSKGIRPVLKVVDDKCLYEFSR